METIKFYKTSSGNEVVDKKLESEHIVNGTFRGEIDEGRPVFHCEDVSEAYNYFYWNGKYFYMDKPKALRTGLYEVRGRIDVLKTYASQIKNLTGTIDRQENKRNGYLIDDKYQAMSYKQIVTKAFPRGMTNDSIILMTVG